MGFRLYYWYTYRPHTSNLYFFNSRLNWLSLKCFLFYWTVKLTIYTYICICPPVRRNFNWKKHKNKTMKLKIKWFLFRLCFFCMRFRVLYSICAHTLFLVIVIVYIYILWPLLLFAFHLTWIVRQYNMYIKYHYYSFDVYFNNNIYE